MSSFKFEIEDNLSKYFNRLESIWDKEEDRTLKTMMESVTGKNHEMTAPIAKRLMLMGTAGFKKYRYNPYLYTSGQDRSYWKINRDGDVASITANYSGMRGFKSSEYFKVWIEFSQEFIDEGADAQAYYYVQEYYSAINRTLNRDYAYYQETGEDDYAEPEDAHHLHFVSEGLQEGAETQIPYALQSNVERVFKMAFPE